MSTKLLERPNPALAEPPVRQVILAIDDDEALVEVLTRRLAQQGFDTISAHTGMTGLAIAQSERPNLILLDLRLPDTDGFAVCEELADLPQTCNIPVIILSGMERPDIIRRSRSAGCYYFVRKPYDPNALLVLIRQALSEATAWTSTEDEDG